ncbi:MAG: methyltransferase [Pseudomonadota bacterium]
MEKKWNIGELLKTSTAYWRGCALQAGVRLGIFTAINKGSYSLSHIAETIKADERGTEYLLNALAAMGLLNKEGDFYSNGSAAREYLSSHSPEYIGHIILHHHHILDGWAQLHEAVTQGHPVETRSYGEDVERESFLMGMFNLAMGIAPALVSQIDISDRRRLLDLGGGPGTYAIHFCLANPELCAVIFDRPTTKPFAMKTVKRFGLADRITFQGGDFHRDPIGGPAFDAAWLSHILHSSGPAECRKIIKKTVAAMEPGGIIMIHEFILDDSKDGPEFPALFSLNMLVNNDDGRSYSEEEIRSMLEDAGVKNIARHPFQGPNDSSIVCGIV